MDLISRVIAGDEDADVLLFEMHNKLRQFPAYSIHLAEVICDKKIDSSSRSLMLEALAGARLEPTDNPTMATIMTCLQDAEEEMRFAAIASAGDLPRDQQDHLRGKINALATSDSSLNVRQAASAWEKTQRGSN